jgi:phage gp36-like protein
MPYATPNDLIARYDVNIVGELATDSGVPISRSDTLNHPNVLKSLLSGSGEVDVALRAGQRYTPAQLAALDENSREHLVDIVCAFAMAWLFRRRPGVHETVAKAIREIATDFKKQLATGVNIFGIVEDASHLEASVPQVTGPTSAEIYDRNLFTARAAGRHFPRPETTNPLSRG